jgi:hypothetical protein
MKANSTKSTSFIQVLLDKYIYYVVINKTYKQSIVTNSNFLKNNNVNLNLA